MAVGRISGPLLSQNLLRNGVDLAFETDLLYLDVNNGHIGIKTSLPQYTLDVNGSFRVIGVSKLGNITITSTATGTIVNNSNGDIIIQSPTEGRLLIKNDTIVTGNLHATGNITAAGSVQLGNFTGSDTLSLYADIISDITPQTSNQYNLGSAEKTWADAYVNNLIATTIVGYPGQDINIGNPPGQNPNEGPITNSPINLNGDVRIWGDQPLGTSPVVSNILYVSMDGSDTNDGRAADASRACRTISGVTNSLYYKSGTSIKVAPGHYYENNPIILKPYTSVIGSDLRTTIIEPINKTQDLFWMQSGNYLAQMQFANGQSGLLPGTGYAPGTNRGAYATAFHPNYGGPKIDLYYSPYIQNCTNQSGPWLMDGTLYRPNQTVQIPKAVGTATWSINTSTLIVYVNEGALSIGQTINVGPTPQDYVDARTLILANKSFIQEQVIGYITTNYPTFVYNHAICSRDVGIIVENVAYDLTFGGNQKSVESGLSYWNGVTSVISTEITTTTNAINYINSLSQSIIANTAATNLLGSFQTQPQVININLTNGGTAGPIISKLISLITGIINNGPDTAPPVQFGNGPDWGSVSAEVLLHTNRSFIQNEVVDWVNKIYPEFVYNEELCYRDTGLIIDAVGQDIILNANAKSVEAGLTYWTGNKNIIANAKFGQENQLPETVAALNHAKAVALQVINNTTVTQSGFIFNTTSCYRDTGLIVDGLAQDLLFGGNNQSIFAGIQYWNHNSYVGKIATEITTTTEAIEYVSSLAQEIVQNITSGIRYQSTVTQNSTLPAATSAEATVISVDFSTITNILTNGVVGITNAIIPNSINASTTSSIINAYNLLLANESYIKAEAIAWVETNKVFRYDKVKCARDTGLIIDSLALDLVFPTNYFSQSTFAGLQYWNQSDYVGTIASELTTMTAAINYIGNLAHRVVVNDTSGPRYTGEVQVTYSGASATPTEQVILANEFSLITNILTTGVSGITDQIISNSISSSTNISVKNAYSLLQANKLYIQDETIAYVNSISSPGFVYTTSTCIRDVSYILDSVSFDLLHGGNRQAIQSGAYYWGYNSTSTAIPNEIPQVIAAYQFLKALTTKIALNEPVTPLQSTSTQVFGNIISVPGNIIQPLTQEIEKIISIIEFGPDIVAYKEPISLQISSNNDSLTAAETLMSNKEFITSEIIAYIDTHLTFQYNPTSCARDIGYILKSVAFDLLYGGNRQSIQSGVYFWGYTNTSTSLPNERSATTLAYEYMQTVVSNVVTGIKMPFTYQASVLQNVSLFDSATEVEVAAILKNISTIVEIINDGPEVVTTKIPINLDRSNNQFVNNAANQLHVNRAFIQAEIVAYVNATQSANPQIILPFYDKGVNATLSLTRNFDIITNIIQNGPHSAPIISQGNGIFVRTGLSLDDVKNPPIIINLTTVTTGVYKVNINQSTIGYGDSAVLYFGDTAVYPLLDIDVPDRWQQRRLNPIGSMGGSLVDGGVISDRSPITSFVYDAFTQVNQGGRGIHIINNGYAQLVSVFTIFCSQAVTVENGGICSITNSNSNFGDICLTAKGYGKREFTGYVKNPPVPPYYPTGYYPRAGTIQVYIADVKLRPHIALVMEIVPPLGYNNYQGFPGFITGNTNLGTLTTGTITLSGLDTTGMVVGQTLYIKDQYGRTSDASGTPYVTTGTLVNDINYQSIILNYPINAGGGDPNNSNYFNIYTCGNAYYTVLSSSVVPGPVAAGTLLLPNSQNLYENSSTKFINILADSIIINQAVTPLQNNITQIFDNSLQGGSTSTLFIANELGIIGSILVNGLSSSPVITYSGNVPSGYKSASSLLNKNKEFIQAETVAYVTQNLTTSYNTATCARDVGFIVDALVNDLATGGNYNAVIAGKSYYAQTGTYHLVELEESVSDPALFPDGATTNFYQRSYMSASGYLFEYVGAGTNYGALPQRGVADPVQTKEVVQINNGKVFFTSTDQNGDFRIGPGLVISQATGVLSGRTFTKSLFANLTPFILAIEGI